MSITVSLEKAKELEWRDVPWYEDYYEVSNTGQIGSKWGVTRNRHWPYRRAWKLLKQSETRWYPCVVLSFRGKRTFAVHLLVAMAFLWEKPEWYECHHIDWNPRNNCIENLEYIPIRKHKIMNRWHRNTSSKYKWVSRDKRRKKRKVKCKHWDKRVRIWYFDSEKNAALAYDKTVRNLWWKHAFTNYPK